MCIVAGGGERQSTEGALKGLQQANQSQKITARAIQMAENIADGVRASCQGKASRAATARDGFPQPVRVSRLGWRLSQPVDLRERWGIDGKREARGILRQIGVVERIAPGNACPLAVELGEIAGFGFRAADGFVVLQAGMGR